MYEAQCVFCDSFIQEASLTKHYNTCESVLVRCGNKCGVKISRKDLSEHYRNECPKSMVACEHCEEKVERQLLEDHLAECVKFRIPCRESCGVEVAREDVERHLDEECQKHFVSCGYKEIQCSYEGFPAGMRQHMKEQMQHHLELTKSVIDKLCLRVESIEKELEGERKRKEELQIKINKLKQVSFLWKVKDIAEEIEKAKYDRSHRIYSPPFYSCKNGYKLRVIMYPDGYFSTHKGHLGVHIQIMSGEYDSLLNWPFTKLVNFRLVAQVPQGEDLVHSFRGMDSDASITSKHISVLSGHEKFVSHEVLNSGSYIVDNAIFLEVSVED